MTDQFREHWLDDWHLENGPKFHNDGWDYQGHYQIEGREYFDDNANDHNTIAEFSCKTYAMLFMKLREGLDLLRKVHTTFQEDTPGHGPIETEVAELLKEIDNLPPNWEALR